MKHVGFEEKSAVKRPIKKSTKMVCHYGRRRRRDTDRDVGVAVDAVVEDDLVDLLVALLHVAAVAETPNVCKIERKRAYKVAQN